MTQNFALSIHHIGGRGGSRRFPALANFEHDIINVLYEADQSAIADMEQEVASLASQQIIIPACVAASEGQTKFYQLWNSGASSYLPISEFFRANYSYLTEDVLELDEKAWEAVTATTIKTATLDDLILRQKNAPPPDFLSINTQGSELDILTGADNLLNDNVLALQTELSFTQIYEAQGGIDDIINHLRDHGFRLFGLQLHGPRGHGFRLGDRVIRAPIGLRGKGAVLQADALFVKEPQWILDNHSDPAVDLAKALFLGFVFEYFEHSYACAKTIMGIGLHQVRSAAIQFRYARFVEEYLNSIEQYPILYPPAWTDIFASVTGKRMEAAAARESYFRSSSKEEFAKAVAFLSNPDFVGVETTAIDYGFAGQAKTMRHHRLAYIWNDLRYLGLADDNADGGAELHLERILNERAT